MAKGYHSRSPEEFRSYLDEIRKQADKLEFIMDDELWTLPKYREMLFTR